MSPFRTMLKHGKPKVDGFRVVSIVVRDSTWAAIKQESTLHNVTMSEMVDEVLTNWAGFGDNAK